MLHCPTNERLEVFGSFVVIYPSDEVTGRRNFNEQDYDVEGRHLLLLERRGT